MAKWKSTEGISGPSATLLVPYISPYVTETRRLLVTWVFLLMRPHCHSPSPPGIPPDIYPSLMLCCLQSFATHFCRASLHASAIFAHSDKARFLQFFGYIIRLHHMLPRKHLSEGLCMIAQKSECHAYYLGSVSSFCQDTYILYLCDVMRKRRGKICYILNCLGISQDVLLSMSCSVD